METKKGGVLKFQKKTKTALQLGAVGRVMVVVAERGERQERVLELKLVAKKARNKDCRNRGRGEMAITGDLGSPV